jgi:hypothetical protein
VESPEFFDEAVTDGPVTPVAKWRTTTATGIALTAIAIGLREALELPTDRPAIVHEVPGGPPDPLEPVELHLDPDHPEATVAVIRPWLLREH